MKIVEANWYQGEVECEVELDCPRTLGMGPGALVLLGLMIPERGSLKLAMSVDDARALAANLLAGAKQTESFLEIKVKGEP